MQSSGCRNSENLNILISNHHLLDYTGSEVYTYYLAKQIKAKGHKPIIYSRYIDRIKKEFINNNIRVTNSLENIKNIRFDVAHTHHSINAIEIRNSFPYLPLVYVSHGVLPFLEHPPVTDINISSYIAVSEEVRDQLINDNINASKISLIRNVIDPMQFQQKRPIREIPKSILVISSRIDDKRLNRVYRAADELNMHVKVVGGRFGQVCQNTISDLIQDADIVFSLGRGVVEAIFSGRIPFVYDYLGGDGLITPNKYDESKKCNFSGRRYKKEFTTEELVLELKKYDKNDIVLLQTKALSEFSLDANVDKLIAIYHWIKNDKITCSEEQIKYAKYIALSLAETRSYTDQWNHRNYLRKQANSRQYDPRNSITTLQKDYAYDVSIIIPLYNKYRLTRQCIDSLYEFTQDVRFELILVDNGSTDETNTELSHFLKKHSNIKLVINSKNEGYSAANNMGANISSGKYLLLLNNDTIVTDNWLRPLMDILDSDDSVAAVGPKLLFPDNKVQHAGLVVINDKKFGDPLVARHVYYKYDRHSDNVNVPMEYQAITGACFLVRKPLYIDAKGLDESFWNGYEDVDLCFKLRNMGYKIVYQPQSEIYHLESQSGPERFTKVSDNIKLLHKKWLRLIQPDIIINEDGTKWKNNNIISPYLSPNSIQTTKKSVPDHTTKKSVTSIIILTFNQLKYTKKCVKSIVDFTPEPHEIIFVDNGSTDGTTKWLNTLCKRHSNFSLIKNTKNMGFAIGCNQGIQKSSGEYILLLNNDVIVTKNWLSGMLDCLVSKLDAGIVGPMTNNISGPQRVPSVPYKSISDLPNYAETYFHINRHRRIQHQRIVGFCMLFHRKLVERIGLLDSTFGTGNFEDDDFCLRSVLHGYRNYIAADIFIHHFGSRSFIGNNIKYDELLNDNKSIFRDKWNGIRQDDPLFEELFLVNSEQRANDLIQMGLHDKAEKVLLDGIRHFPKRHKLVSVLADLLCEINRYEDALNLLNAMSDQKHQFRGLLTKGFCYVGLNQLHEAESVANQLCSYEKTKSQGFNLKGVLAYKQGNVSEAESFFSSAINMDPSYGEAHANLGILYWESGKRDQALPFYERSFILASDVSNNASNYHVAAIELGAIDQAQKVFMEANALFPLNRQICFLHIDLLIRQGDYPAAIDAIENAIVLFGIEDGMLKAGLEVRRKIKSDAIAHSNDSNPTVAVCIAIKEDSSHLPIFLHSIKLYVDEVIIISTISNSKIRDLAECFGAKYYSHTGASDNTSIRQLGFSKAHCDWILFLDGDEKIAAIDLKKLAHLKEQRDNSAAYSFKIRNYSNSHSIDGLMPNKGDYPNEEAGIGWIENEQVRFFPRCILTRFKNYPLFDQESIFKALSIPVMNSGISIHKYALLSNRTIELHDAAQQIDDASFPSLIFVVGIPRSGTTWLLSILENHPDCTALTPQMLDIDISHPTKETGLFVKGFSNSQILQKICNLPTNAVYVEKTPSHLFELKRIKKLFPHAKIILIKRDPIDVVYSMTRKNPFWREGSPQSLDDAIKMFRRFSKAQHSWNDYDFTIEYEELWNNTLGEVNRLFSFLGFSINHIQQIIDATQYGRNLNGNLKSVFRKGVPGQGHSKFSERQKALIKKSIFPIGTCRQNGEAHSEHLPNELDKSASKTTVFPSVRNSNDKGISSQTDVNSSKLLKDASRFYKRGNYSAALNTVLHIISNHPSLWEAYSLFVDVMLQSGQEARIVEYLSPLEDRQDLPAGMLALIGSGYEASGHLAKAAEYAKKALSADPDCPRAWNLKGVLAYNSSNLPEAAECFQKASECDAGWGDPWTNMGTIHWEQGAYDKALECYEIGFQLSPTTPNVATTYHVAISESGQFDRAKPHFEKIVADHPDFRKARFLLIDILIRLEAYQAALDQIETVLVRFFADPQLLEAAKTIRAKVGPMTIQEDKHPSLSLCMIVKNEEKYLPRCLESLKPIVDEMIIVDTGSTDTTRDIAEVFGAKVFDYEWNDDFAAARNHSLDQASGDWILVMDADEVIAIKDNDKIRKLLKQTELKDRAYMIVTRNYTHRYNIIGWVANTGQYREEETGAGWVPSEKVRLFPNKDGIRFDYPVHEVVGPSLARKKIPVKMCPCPVHHYGKLDSTNDRKKDETYFKIGMDKLSASYDDPVAIREMAVQAAKLDKYEEAILLWKRLIAIEPKDPFSFINLASGYGKVRRYHKAREAAKTAVEMAPHIKEAHLNLGLSELHLGNCPKAIKIFTKLVNSDNQYHSATFLLGASHFCVNEMDKGKKILETLQGAAAGDNLSYSLQELIESMMAVDDRKDFVRHLIEGAEKLKCSNNAIQSYKFQLDTKAA